jgi:plasmid stabilization system protein ParE
MQLAELKTEFHNLIDKTNDLQIIELFYNAMNRSVNSDGSIWGSLTAEQQKGVIDAYEESKDKSSLISLNVVFSSRAERDFEDIITYIKGEFGSKASLDFKSLVFHFTDLVKAFPEIGSLELPEKNIRGFVVHKRLKIFYQVSDDNLIILRLFDTRQHPDKK